MRQEIIFVTEPEYVKARSIFEQARTQAVRFVESPSDEETLAALVGEAEALGVIVGTTKYVGPLYAALPVGGIIARFGVGVDSVDRKKAKANGIYLTNTPGVLDFAVAEHAMFLIGALARNIPGQSDEMHRNVWLPRLGTQLQGKKLALVGFGQIAREVARMAAMGFRMDISAFSPTANKERQNFAAELSGEAAVAVRVTRGFDEAVYNARFVSVHLPLMGDTHAFVDAPKIAAMTKGAYLVNTSRGGVVDEAAVYDALVSSQLAGAAFDVFQHEPYTPVDPEKDLRTLRHVIMTPHVASSTDVSNSDMARACISNVMARIEGRLDDMTTV